MGSDPKTTEPHRDEPEEEDGNTAMFSREAHGWFSSMADAQEGDPEATAELGRAAVIESSPLTRTGEVPTAAGARPAPAPARPASVPVTIPVRASGSPQSQPGAPPPRAGETLGPRQVVILAFAGGALVAVLIGAIAFFALTAR